MKRVIRGARRKNKTLTEVATDCSDAICEILVEPGHCTIGNKLIKVTVTVEEIK